MKEGERIPSRMLWWTGSHHCEIVTWANSRVWCFLIEPAMQPCLKLILNHKTSLWYSDSNFHLNLFSESWMFSIVMHRFQIFLSFNRNEVVDLVTHFPNIHPPYITTQFEALKLAQGLGLLCLLLPWLIQDGGLFLASVRSLILHIIKYNSLILELN